MFVAFCHQSCFKAIHQSIRLVLCLVHPLDSNWLFILRKSDKFPSIFFLMAWIFFIHYTNLTIISGSFLVWNMITINKYSKMHYIIIIKNFIVIPKNIILQLCRQTMLTLWMTRRLCTNRCWRLYSLILHWHIIVNFN